MELLQDFDVQSICVSRAQRLVLSFAAAVVVLYSLALRFVLINIARLFSA
jgi:hypothetical protein